MLNKPLKRSYSENKVQKDYALVAAIYNLWSRLTESNAHAKVVEESHVKDGEKILEVGCGTGILFAQLVKSNPSGTNIGIDLSTIMLDKAKKLMKDQGKIGQYQLIEGSAYHLPFDNNQFDLLVNNFMFDLLPINDFYKILKEFHRVLKPEGRLVVSTMGKGNRWYHGFWRMVAKYMPTLLTGCRPVSMSEYLIDSGFFITNEISCSQNTFPSEIIVAQSSKPV